MKTRLATLAAAVCLASLGACAKQERVREIDWARSALARNPAFEILATDESTGVFTVRDTTSGSVRTLRLEDLIATPLPARTTSASASQSVAATQPPDVAAASAEVVDEQTTEVVAAVPAGTGNAMAEGPGYRIVRAADAAVANIDATLEGPGYRITRDAPVNPQRQPTAEASASNVEKRTDPIICQGDRLMRIDGETIEFTGDALIVEKGCDLYISNTNIRAGGIGIIARQARVHIVNSTIGGTRGSYEASEGAQIYVARSTFTGVGRRFDSATMNDLGGNAYQTH